jgi:hypothetical protein
MGKHFVLIHGAWHGGWSWDGVIEKLKLAGHTAEAPTMPGHGPDDDRSRIAFGDYVDRIADVLKRQTEPVGSAAYFPFHNSGRHTSFCKFGHSQIGRFL